MVKPEVSGPVTPSGDAGQDDERITPAGTGDKVCDPSTDANGHIFDGKTKVCDARYDADDHIITKRNKASPNGDAGTIEKDGEQWAIRAQASTR